MTKQQENRAFVKILKEFPKAFGRVSFRERLMLRTAFSYVVEEVVADIEKENAELKEQLNFKTRYVKGEKAIDQLAQAKEIIKELLLLPYANNEEVYADVTSTLDKAEQFLKEIEK